MEKHKITAFLITGQPGVGKTTLVRKICAKLGEQNKLQGFYTEEVRENGQRIGFDVVTMDGTRCILAREKPMDNLHRPKIGKYSVYVEDFENLTLPLIKSHGQSQHLMILDEIGKMELYSKRFQAAVHTLLLQKQLLLATIPSQTRQPIPLVEQLRSSPSALLFQVTKANRDGLVNEIAEHIIKALRLPL